MLLTVSHLTKSYDGTDILTDVSFHLGEREKAAIVGINGAGKTTLLRQITGEEEPDAGTVTLARGTTLGYLAQHQEYTAGGTIYNAVYEVNQALLSVSRRMEEARAAIPRLAGDALTEKVAEYTRLVQEFERMDGYAYKSEVVGVLRGLGFSEDSFDDDASLLSGGQKTRLSLARLLLSRPSFLILDEPTNHLDMDSVAFLENYLIGYPGALLVVSHDRYFINRIVGYIIEIENGTSRVYSGNYDAYTAKKEQLRIAQRNAWLGAQRKIEHEKAVIDKLRSFNREKSIRRAESREKKLERITLPDRPTEEKTDMRLILTPSNESGNDVLLLTDVAKAFGHQKLFDGVSFLIRKGEKAALIGRNGTGKSTLLKIIMGLVPMDKGTVRRGAGVVIGYYDQENLQLHPEKTIFEEISDEWPSMNNTRIRSVLAAFLFTGEDVFKRIGDLSGGEKARVAFAKLMLGNANLLVLDEPTNHLDIHSRAILEEAIRSYTGTVLVVSHDRYFLNRTTTRIFELRDGEITSTEGDYDYYLEKKAEREAAALPAAAANAAPASAEKEKWLDKKREEAARRKKENDLLRLEKQIAESEKRIAAIDALFQDIAVATDAEKLRSLTEERASLAAGLEEAYERWEALADS